MNKLEEIFKALEKLPIEELKERVSRAEESISNRVYSDDFEVYSEVPKIEIKLKPIVNYKYDKYEENNIIFNNAA